jgi:hypothetical protein
MSIKAGIWSAGFRLLLQRHCGSRTSSIPSTVVVDGHTSPACSTKGLSDYDRCRVRTSEVHAEDLVLGKRVSTGGSRAARAASLGTSASRQAYCSYRSSSVQPATLGYLWLESFSVWIWRSRPPSTSRERYVQNARAQTDPLPQLSRALTRP